MTFQQLQYIVEIYRTGSFSKTAQTFYVTQASISRAVNALEAELGFQIFYRKWNGVVPTRKGRMVLEEANRILISCRRIAGGREENRRTFHVSFPRYAPFSRAFVRLQQELEGNADVRVSQVEAEEEHVLGRLAMTEADLCIIAPFSDMYSSWRHWTQEREIDCALIGCVPAVIRISPAHPLYDQKGLELKDFLGQAIIDRGEMTTATLVRAYMDIDRNRALLTEREELRDQLREAGLGYTIGYQSREPGSDREIPLGMNHVFLALSNPKNEMPDQLHRFLELVEEELGPRHGRTAAAELEQKTK